MSHTDSRTTIRELRAALARRKADPGAERDRKNWGSTAMDAIVKRRAVRKRRYSARRAIRDELD